jgi:hypothetical protein
MGALTQLERSQVDQEFVEDDADSSLLRMPI